jgi:hypothetical protein
MLTILLSLCGGMLVGAVIGLAFGKLVYGILPGMIIGLVLLVFAGRRVWAGLQADMAKIEALLRPSNHPTRPELPPFDDAIGALEGIIERWRWWVPMLRVQLNGQIGYLYYMQKKWKEAEPVLLKSSPRQGLTYAMLAAIQHRRKQYDTCRATMEVVVRHTKKDAFLWNLYAWMLSEQDLVADAIRVLHRALEQVPTDERTRKNLEALQNGKPMKMRAFELMWYQFHFETPPPMMRTPGGQIVPAPKNTRGAVRGR